MKKIIFVFTLSIFIFSLFSFEVNKSELENSTNSQIIEFINYTGPHKTIDSIQAIMGIGSELGKNIPQNLQINSTFGSDEKYKIIHAIDSNEKIKLDADILIIGKNSTVDHITNLRRIISGYLINAYDYSEQDAQTLAVFITVYNAVYRNKIEIFTEKYKKIVIDNISEDKCGLSIDYKDWPGFTQIIIPLYDVSSANISTIDTSVISDSKVVSSMKEDDDKNIESRKNLVDIKERESEQASENAKESQKKVVEEQKKLTEEKQKTLETKKIAENSKKEAEVAQKIADENPDDFNAQKEANEKQEIAEQNQQIYEEQKNQQEKQEQIVEEYKSNTQEQQNLADKKQNEAHQERKEIAKDQTEVQKREATLSQIPVDFGMVLTDENQLLSRLVKFNKQNGEIIKNSPLTVIRNRIVYKTSNGNDFVAIAGENVNNGSVKLVIIDENSMEIKSESVKTIAENSVLVKDGQDFYCIIQEENDFFLGKFGENLVLKLKSEIQVKSSTPITVTDSSIIITDINGQFKVISKDDLK